MAYTLSSGTNTYVPSFEATGQIIGYVRNPAQFAITSYSSDKQVDKNIGYYAKIDPADPARVVNLADFAWADGNDEPRGWENTTGFEFKAYETTRYAVPFWLGTMAVAQAPWDMVAEEATNTAHQMRVLQTKNACTQLTTAGNWGSNTATAKTLNGLDTFWQSGTTANPAILASLLAAFDAIAKATNGVVTPDKLKLVVNPTAARTMAQSAEIRDYVKSSPFSKEYLEMNNISQIERFGLPAMLYGVETVVETTSEVSTRKGAASTTRAYSFPDNKAVLCAKSNAIQSQYGTAFNTLTRFWFQDNFTVEQKDDPDNRRIKGRVVVNEQYVVTAPESGYYITNLFS